MRKLLSGLLVLVMLVALLPVTALAAQEAGPVAASAVLENGTVTLTLTAGEETTSGRLTVAYDKELLTYAGLETKGTVTSEEAGEGAVTFGYAASGKDALAAGSVVATVRFTAKSALPATRLTVTVEDFNAREGLHLELPAVLVGGLPFTDVSEGDWYYDAVAYVWQEGLFRGMDETTFAPNLAMNRAMFVTVLGRMAGVEEDRTATSKFTDVKAGSYYAGYVAWAAEQDIVRGTSETTFSPNAKVTREQRGCAGRLRRQRPHQRLGQGGHDLGREPEAPGGHRRRPGAPGLRHPCPERPDHPELQPVCGLKVCQHLRIRKEE